MTQLSSNPTSYVPTDVDPWSTFNRVKQLIDPGEWGLDFAIPGGNAPLVGVELGAVINLPGGTGSTSPPGYQAPNLAAPDLPSTPLSAVVYQGVVAALDLPVLPTPAAVAYAEGQSAGAAPSAAPSTPPTDYPTQALADISGDAGLSDVALPSISVGTRPTMREIGMDRYRPVDLEPFTAGMPVADDLAGVEAVVGPSATVEDTSAFADALALILAGEALMPDAGQAALYQTGIEDADDDERKAENLAFHQAGARGFFQPTPGLANDLINIAEQSRRARRQASRQVRDDVHRQGMALLDAAVQAQGQLDAAHVGWYLSEVGRLVRVQRFNVALLAEVYRAAVGVYNLKVGLLRRLVQAHKEYLAAVAEQNRAVAADGDVLAHQARSYRAEVGAFEQQAQTVGLAGRVERLRVRLATLPIEEYRATLDGVQANVGIVRRNVQALGEAVGSIGRLTEHELARFDASSAQQSAAASQLALDQANLQARASAEQIEGQRRATYAGFTAATLQRTEAAAAEYRDYLDKHRRWAGALLDKLNAEAQALRSYAAALDVEIGTADDWNRAESARTDADNSLSLAQAQQSLRQQALDAQATAAAARIEAGRLAARAGAAAGAASSAFGVTSASVALSASAGSVAGTTESYGNSFGNDARRGWSLNRNHQAES